MAYHYELAFTRLHTTGTLKGEKTSDTLQFCSEQEAFAWLHATHKYAARNGYTVSSFTLRRLPQ